MHDNAWYHYLSAGVVLVTVVRLCMILLVLCKCVMIVMWCTATCWIDRAATWPMLACLHHRVCALSMLPSDIVFMTLQMCAMLLFYVCYKCIWYCDIYDAVCTCDVMICLVVWLYVVVDDAPACGVCVIGIDALICVAAVMHMCMAVYVCSECSIYLWLHKYVSAWASGAGL